MLLLYFLDFPSWQSPSQTLTEFGPITIGTLYHLKIATNSTFTTIEATSPDKEGVYSFHRENRTWSDHIGKTAGVWMMSGKYGSTSYNRGHGTLSNVTIISYDFVPGTTLKPTAAPSIPSISPTESFLECVMRVVWSKEIFKK